MAWDRNLMPRPQARAWEYWSTRLKKAGEYPAGAPKKRGQACRRPPRPEEARPLTAPQIRASLINSSRGF